MPSKTIPPKKKAPQEMILPSEFARKYPWGIYKSENEPKTANWQDEKFWYNDSLHVLLLAQRRFEKARAARLGDHRRSLLLPSVMDIRRTAPKVENGHKIIDGEFVCNCHSEKMLAVKAGPNWELMCRRDAWRLYWRICINKSIPMKYFTWDELYDAAVGVLTINKPTPV